MVTAAGPSVRHFRVDAGGFDIVGDDRGPVDAPPILLLAGGGQTRHSWRRVATAIARRGQRAVNVDSRGHGETGRPLDGDYRLDRFVEDLQCVVAALDATPVLIGASLGGLTALAAEARLGPGFCRALCMVDVSFSVQQRGSDRIRGFMASGADGFTSVEEARTAVVEYLRGHGGGRSEGRGLTRNLRQQEDGRWYWHWDPAFLAGTQSFGSSWDSASMRAAAERIRVPLLLLRGERSDVLSEDDATALLDAVPTARVEVVGNASHMVAGVTQDIFWPHIDAFLDEVFDPA